MGQTKHSCGQDSTQGEAELRLASPALEAAPPLRDLAGEVLRPQPFASHPSPASAKGSLSAAWGGGLFSPPLFQDGSAVPQIPSSLLVPPRAL